jgi:hypothetical protein
MTAQVLLTMKSGEKLMVEGWQRDISKKIKDAREKGETMIELDLPLTPTGQKVTIDPNEVTIIIKDPYQ